MSVTCGRSVISPGISVSSSNKTDRHDITEIVNSQTYSKIIRGLKGKRESLLHVYHHIYYIMFVEIKDEEPIDYCRLHEGKQSIEDNNVIIDVEKIKVYCVTAYFKSNCVVCVVLCCVFCVLFVFSRFLCVQCCQCLWIVHSWLPLPFSLTFI